MAFTYSLSIRKVPGVGRVNERLLESIGVKVRSGQKPLLQPNMNHTMQDLRGHFYPSGNNIVDG